MNVFSPFQDGTSGAGISGNVTHLPAEGGKGKRENRRRSSVPDSKVVPNLQQESKVPNAGVIPTPLHFPKVPNVVFIPTPAKHPSGSYIFHDHYRLGDSEIEWISDFRCSVLPF